MAAERASRADERSKRRWEDSFAEQVARHAYNTAAVESVVRTVSYYLRDRFPSPETAVLHFLEMGCGAGPNLVWLAQKGIRVSGVDISPTALGLAHQRLQEAGYGERIGKLAESSVSSVPFPDDSFDGIVEACVFQHLARDDREAAFGEVRRLLRPGGIFVGYMLSVAHTVFQAKGADELADDPGTLLLSGTGSKLYLTNIGLSHFFRSEEIRDLLGGFSVVDPCMTAYALPKEEAGRRGYADYIQAMWTVCAVK